MTNPIKFGIVGLGKMGSVRERTIRENDKTILILGTDPNPPTNGFMDIRILPDYRSVINSGVDAAFVCTLNRFIPKVVVAALDEGKVNQCEDFDRASGGGEDRIDYYNIRYIIDLRGGDDENKHF